MTKVGFTEEFKDETVKQVIERSYTAPKRKQVCSRKQLVG
jgi:hypothetical protein